MRTLYVVLYNGSVCGGHATLEGAQAQADRMNARDTFTRYGKATVRASYVLVRYNV